jgi:hypothetical protein
MVESVLGIRNASHMLLHKIYGEFVKSNVLRIIERTVQFLSITKGMGCYMQSCCAKCNRIISTIMS